MENQNELTAPQAINYDSLLETSDTDTNNVEQEIENADTEETTTEESSTETEAETETEDKEELLEKDSQPEPKPVEKSKLQEVNIYKVKTPEGKELQISGETVIKKKADGKVREVTLDELTKKFAFDVAYDRMLEELHVHKRPAGTERATYDNKQKENQE
jgi:hypothetical protein